jgi:hypothetical protein
MPQYPEQTSVHKVYANPHQVAQAWSLDRGGERAITEAYHLSLEHICPFNTAIGVDMHYDIRHEHAVNPQTMYLVAHRDGKMPAIAIEAEDPVFYEERFRDVAISKTMLEAVMLDYEAVTRTQLQLPDSFRSRRTVIDGNQP